MDKKILVVLRIVAVICIFVLIVEFIYINSLKQDKSIYFDSINSIVLVDDDIVAVGSNNNNDMYYEKAKITKYSLKKEKLYEKIYNKGYNGVFFDAVYDDDSVVVVGSYESNNEERKKDVRRALIVKYDNDGNVIYDADFKLLDNSKFTSIVVVDDGYLVTGQSVYDSLTLGFSDKGGAVLAKYNKKLELEWKKNIGDNKTAIYNSLFVLDDRIYVCGMSSSLVGLVSMYNLNGELIDTVEYKYTDNLGFTDITYFDDKLYLASGKKNEDEKNSYDAIVVVYDMKLNFYKEEIYDGNADERFNQLMFDSDDSLVVIGNSFVVDDIYSHDKVNAFVHNGLLVKYDKKLDKSFVVEYGDERDDYFTSIVEYNDNYLISGFSSYEDGSYMSKFITYSKALKMLGVEQNEDYFGQTWTN